MVSNNQYKTTTNLGVQNSSANYVTCTATNAVFQKSQLGDVRGLTDFNVASGEGFVMKVATANAVNPTGTVESQLNIVSNTSVNIFTGTQWVAYQPRIGFCVFDTTNNVIKVWKNNVTGFVTV